MQFLPAEMNSVFMGMYKNLWSNVIQTLNLITTFLNLEHAHNIQGHQANQGKINTPHKKN